MDFYHLAPYIAAAVACILFGAAMITETVRSRRRRKDFKKRMDKMFADLEASRRESEE